MDLSISEVTQIATSIGVLIAAVASVIGLFKIEKVHTTTNSKMDLLLKTTKAAAEAKGRKDAEDEAALRNGL